MNRSTMTLIGVAVALAAVFGVATVTAPKPAAAGTPVSAAAETKPVQRSTLLCPAPTGTDYDSSTYAAYTPPGTSAGGAGGSAHMTAGTQTDGAGDVIGSKAAAHPKSIVPLTAPGKPVTAPAGKSTWPLIGTADGRFAPGWTVQETTTIAAGAGRGLLGTSCSPASTDFWFPGASLATHRQDYVHLTNPDDTAAVADIELYDAKGEIKTTGGEGITIPGGSSVPVLLSTLTGDESPDLTVHIAVRTGRVGAAVQAMDTVDGADWLPPAATPADSAVLPGIPADATSVHLVASPTGSEDADLKVQLLTPTGPITPAGHETLHLKSGMATAIDLPKLTQGQAGSLRLTPTDPDQKAPFVAAVRVVRGGNGSEETAFVPSTDEVGRRATVVDNHSVKGSVLSLAATEAAATVRITTSATSSGGSPVSRTVMLKAGTTVAEEIPKPTGRGNFAVTVEVLSGGPVYAARELREPTDGLASFTIQTMPDDGGFVAVPLAGQDLSILDR